MGRWHLHAARKLGADVVGVVDQDLGAAQVLLRRLPKAVATTDITSLLHRADVQVAHVCTPLSSHLPLALELVASGVHVLIEKPLARTASETRRLVEAARRTGVLICPVHQYAWQAGVNRVAIGLPNFGPIKRLEFTICSAGGEQKPSDSLDEILFDILPHPLSLVQRLMPSIDLARIEWRVLHPASGDALVVAEHGGTLLSIFISMGGRPSCFVVSLQCGRASAVIDGFHGYSVVMNGAASYSAKITRPFANALQSLGAALTNLSCRAVRQEFAYPGLREIVERFYGAIQQRDDRLLPVSGEAAISLAVARDRIMAEMRPGRVEASSTTAERLQVRTPACGPSRETAPSRSVSP